MNRGSILDDICCYRRDRAILKAVKKNSYMELLLLLDKGCKSCKSCNINNQFLTVTISSNTDVEILNVLIKYHVKPKIMSYVVHDIVHQMAHDNQMAGRIHRNPGQVDEYLTQYNNKLVKLEKFLELGASPNIYPWVYEAPIYAARRCKQDVVDLLLKYGAVYNGDDRMF